MAWTEWKKFSSGFEFETLFEKELTSASLETHTYTLDKNVSEVLFIVSALHDNGVTPTITCNNSNSEIEYYVNISKTITTSLYTNHTFVGKISNLSIGDVITFKSTRGVIEVYG